MPSLPPARVPTPLISLRTRAEAAAARVPRWVWGAVLIGLFLAAAWVSATRPEIDAATLRPGLIALAILVGVPLTVLANTLEYRHSALAVATRVPLLDASRVAILATAANLLPLPGGVLVRIAALRRSGVGTGQATGVTAVVGIVWVAVALVVAGIALATTRMALGGVLAVVGVVIVVVATTWAHRLPGLPRPIRWMAMLLAIELGSVLASALRLSLALAALGMGFSVRDGGVLAISGVISNSVGLIPAGLGLKEAITAGLATLLALPAGIGFVVSVLDRAVGLVGHGLLAAPLLIGRGR